MPLEEQEQARKEEMRRDYSLLVHKECAVLPMETSRWLTQATIEFNSLMPLVASSPPLAMKEEVTKSWIGLLMSAICTLPSPLPLPLLLPSSVWLIATTLESRSGVVMVGNTSSTSKSMVMQEDCAWICMVTCMSLPVVHLMRSKSLIIVNPST
jgi:hypothetical protein